MLGTGFASSEKVSELDFGRRSAGRHVGFVYENTFVLIATEEPPVTVLAVVNLTLGHLRLLIDTPPSLDGGQAIAFDRETELA